MKSPVFLTGALIVLSSPALCAAQTANGAVGFTLTTTPTQVTLSWSGSGNPAYYRIVNPGASGSAWCTRASGSPAANAAGSYEIPAGSSEEFRAPGYVPTTATWCVSASGSVPLTVEIH